MHPEYQRYLRHRLIRRWLLFGVLPLFLITLTLLPIFTARVSPRDPWIAQFEQLRRNQRFIDDYRAQNAGRWPAAFADLTSTVADTPDARKPVPFIDPETHQPSPWLLFDPAHVTPLPEYGRIIASAPRSGPSNKSKGLTFRIVMFDKGVITLIPESDFLAATRTR